jgi:hypothetical protein
VSAAPPADRIAEAIHRCGYAVYHSSEAREIVRRAPPPDRESTLPFEDPALNRLVFAPLHDGIAPALFGADRSELHHALLRCGADAIDGGWDQNYRSQSLIVPSAEQRWPVVSFTFVLGSAMRLEVRKAHRADSQPGRPTASEAVSAGSCVATAGGTEHRWAADDPGHAIVLLSCDWGASDARYVARQAWWQQATWRRWQPFIASLSANERAAIGFPAADAECWTARTRSEVAGRYGITL